MQNYIYIGPTSPQLGLKESMLFLTPDPPEPLKPYIEKEPMIKALYIPTSFLGEARRNLRTDPSSVERLAYKSLAETISKLPR